MAKVGIVMGSDSDLEVMAKAAEERIQCDHRGSRHGSSSAWNVRGTFPAAGHWRSHAYVFPRRERQSVFDRSDAARNPGGDSRDQWRKECRASCCEDAGCKRSGASCETQRVFCEDVRRGSGKGQEAAGKRISGVQKIIFYFGRNIYGLQEGRR